ncbi:molecular chaperone [Dyella sp. GSA-30]|uniref:fimbrial biogenesis chaperone n=1 Tax=Dyella sp. GSA-30 TaxID=2994496 RepID=UPI00249313BB|nr:molecular chaperone [Dyella sp. GSA-30]BDU22142.1 pilus assembly protein [Dyella sp. GSA-30]
MKRTWLRYTLGGALFAGLLMPVGASASGLQVAPTTLSLKASQNADGLWLINTGDNVVHAQVRVYHWTQNDQGDQLIGSRGLVISPPMLQLAAGDRQLIRVIRTGAPPNGTGAVEDAYRLAIDELPIDVEGKQGLQFVLHYSVPIFIEPVGATAPPQLQWNLLRHGEQVMLRVSNHGGSHAQLAALSYIDTNGHRTDINPGLLGYVLPGATMQWMLKPPAAAFAAGGILEAMINGEKAAQDLSLADRSR